MSARVVIIGGGIAGLTAARHLSSHHAVTVLEAGPSLGGKLVSDELLGRPIDLGPDSFITRNPAGEKLCEDVGIADQLIAPSSNSVALYAKGALRALPSGIVLGIPTDRRALARSGLVGPSSRLRARLDLHSRHEVLPADALERARRGIEDPSVAEVFAPRFGLDVVHALIDPLLGGINASDATHLSLAASAPQLAGRLAGKRSVLRALASETPTFSLNAGRPPFLGLEEGMGSLGSALVRALTGSGVELRCGAAVHSLELRTAGGYRLWTDSDEIEADAVLIATPASVAATLLGPLHPDLGAELASIPYASVVTAVFCWSEDAVPDSTIATLRQLIPSASASASSRALRLPGSGVMVPRDGKRLLTAATFTSSKWPRSANPGQVVIRTFAGRHGDERAITLDDDTLVRGVLGDLSEVLGIEAPPLERLVRRWPSSLPQFVTGHLARLSRITTHLESLRGVELAGAAYQGIGIPACIDNATAAAERLAALLES